MDHFWLTDEQFAQIAPHLPTDTRGKGRVDDRRVISGIIHVLKSGGRWVDAPSFYGPHKTLYNRYVRWAAKGVWFDLFHTLASAGGPPAQVLTFRPGIVSRLPLAAQSRPQSKYKEPSG